jgi:hypothetical protein
MPRSYKPHKVLGLIRRSFSAGLDTKTKKNLYILLVRSQLSYGSQIWRPHLVKDIIMLDGTNPATCYKVYTERL